MAVLPPAETRTGEKLAQRIQRLSPASLPITRSQLLLPVTRRPGPRTQVTSAAQRMPSGSRGAAASLEDPTHNQGVCQYTVLERLGQGACSTVHKAQRIQDGLPVALKLMKRSSDEFEDLAKQEFEMLRSIENPNIIKAIDFMSSALYGYIGIVLELFNGNDLDSVVATCGPLSADTALKLFLQLVEAIAYLHLRGIIHRDIKAENILVDHDLSALKLVDFNVATRLEKGALTPTGTPSYFSPEVREGEPPDEAQDVWAMGLCLHLMLRGWLPFNRCAVAGESPRRCWPEDQQISMERICGVALSRSLEFHKSRRATAPTLLADLRGQLSLIPQYE